jgi:hypothetical protein
MPKRKKRKKYKNAEKSRLGAARADGPNGRGNFCAGGIRQGFLYNLAAFQRVCQEQTYILSWRGPSLELTNARRNTILTMS